MSNRPSPSPARRAAWALALTPAALVVTATGTASAAPPSSWPNTPHVSPIYVILVLGAIPLALFALITLLVYLPSMRRGDGHAAGEAWRGDPEWFGGPRQGLEAVDAAAPAAVTSGGSTAVGGGQTDGGPGRGGTSGHW